MLFYVINLFPSMRYLSQTHCKANIVTNFVNDLSDQNLIELYLQVNVSPVLIPPSPPPPQQPSSPTTAAMVSYITIHHSLS